MSYLLDTNFVIGLLRGASSYWDCLDELLEKAIPTVSVVTRAEIFAGCHPNEQRATSNLLDRFQTITLQSSVADLAGNYVYRYRKRGIILHLEDALIGATAVFEGLILVSRNVSDFPMLSLGQNLLRFPY